MKNYVIFILGCVVTFILIKLPIILYLLGIAFIVEKAIKIYKFKKSSDAVMNSRGNGKSNF